MSEQIESEFIRRRRTQLAADAAPSARAGKPVRVLVADRSRLLAEALMITLDVDPSLEPIGYALDGHEALELIEQLDPDVVLLGTGLDSADAVSALLASTADTTSVVALGAAPDGGSGACGAAESVSHERSADELLDAVRAAYGRRRSGGEATAVTGVGVG